MKINVNALDGDRCTMLHHAARKGSLKSLKVILQAYVKGNYATGTGIYAVDVRNNTALHYAAMGGIILFNLDHATCIK